MTIRPFDWRDLPNLHHNRNKSVILDSELLLTSGPMLVPGAILSYLAPAMGVFTCVSNEGRNHDQSLIGQVIHPMGSQFAHLTFLTPDDVLELMDVYGLIDYFVQLSGERGAFRLLADVDECSPTYEILRRAGFAIYTRQRIWKLVEKPSDENKYSHWRSATSRDIIAIRSLYSNLAPGMVQQIEPFPSGRLHGWVYQVESDILAYVDLKSGLFGIWAQPFVHPDVEDISACFRELLKHLSYRSNRPLYFCVRSYQSWLEAGVRDLGADPGPQQAVMVKHLTATQKAVRSFALPSLESGHPEVTAPIARMENH